MTAQLPQGNQPLLADGRIGTLLVSKGLITEPQLEECLALQKIDEPLIIDSLLGHLLITKEYVTEEDVAQTYAEQIGMPFLDVDLDRLDPEVTQYLHSCHLFKQSCAPLYEEGSDLIVGTPFGDNLRLYHLFPLDWTLYSHPNYVSSDVCKAHIITESAFYQALEHGNQGEHDFNIQDPPYLTARRREIMDAKHEEDYQRGIEEGTIHVHMEAIQVKVNGRDVYLSSAEASALANMEIQRNARARKDAMQVMPEVKLIK